MKCYALYKGDTFLSVGTIAEIASEIKVTEGCIKSYVNRVGCGNQRVLFELEGCLNE